MSIMRMGGDSVPADGPDHRLKDIRRAMLECLIEAHPGDELTRLRARIMYSADADGLWYLRSDIMNLLAGKHGETFARERLVLLTGMFHGLMPAGMKARTAPPRNHQQKETKP
jgi:hypothetical protein